MLVGCLAIKYFTEWPLIKLLWLQLWLFTVWFFLFKEKGRSWQHVCRCFISLGKKPVDNLRVSVGICETDPQVVIFLYCFYSQNKFAMSVIQTQCKSNDLNLTSDRSVCIPYYRCNNYMFFKAWFCEDAWAWHHKQSHLNCFITEE